MTKPFSLRCAAILFDLDGVLVDSTACVERTWRHWAAQHQLDPARVVGIAHGRRTIETVRLVAPHLSAAAEVERLITGELAATEGVIETPGARDLLEHLPHGAWAIVTSGVRAVAMRRLRHTGLPVPPILVCAEEVARGKPDPEGYLLAAARLDVAAGSCIVIEDAPPGLEAAQAAGMRAIAVASTYPPDALYLADFTVSRLTDLRITRAPDDGVLDVGLASI